MKLMKLRDYETQVVIISIYFVILDTLHFTYEMHIPI